MNAEKGVAISKHGPGPDAGLSNLITLSLRTRLVPQEGWITFLLLMALLISVVWSVQQADWVATNNLIAVVFWAALAGLILAKLKAPWPLLHLAGVAIGFVVVMWQTANLTEAESIVPQVQEAWSRVTLWTNAALKGGISTDLLPFSLLLFIFGWLVAYLSSWFIFRRRNIWVAILLPGIGMLTNLSYLPDPFAGHFFIFLFLSMLLVVRMTMLQRISIWNRSKITFNHVRTWLTLSEAVWFGLAVVLIVALLPLKAISPSQLRNQWEEMRSPARRVEDEFARLFSGLPARKTIPVRVFGPSLAFQGKIALSGVPVLWVNSDYPSYWVSHTYDSYITQGWVSSADRKLDIEPDGTLISPQPYKGQITVSQRVKVGFSSDAVFLGGDLVHIDRKIQVKTLREPISGEGRLLSTNTKSNEVPFALDIVAARFSKRLNPNDAYSLDSSVSIAPDSDLRRSGTDYPEWIKDHYLQLPDSLPDRVKVLAREVTRKADNPLDKALAVQGYLRSVEYNREIDAPPFKADGVDFFLFETRKGDSDYFASAMAVMLRSVGVPVRVAAGYWYGTYDTQEETYIIKDTDSHAWPQVYFPHYGWIDFEPSPNRPLPQRELPLRDFVNISEEFEYFLEEPLENSRGFEEELIQNEGNPIERAILTPLFSSLAAAVFLGVLSLIAWWYSWHHRLASVEVAERSYIKMSRLASLARLQRGAQETPMEYANKLGQAIPPIHEEAKSIARAFEQVQYGRRNLTDEESGIADLAWRKVRGWLLMRAITGRLRRK